MKEAKSINIEVDYVDVIEFFTHCVSYCQTEDKKLLFILAEEKTKAGLEDKIISLFTPEESDFEESYYMNPCLLGDARTSNDEEYEITLYPLVLIKDYARIRKTIRHELAHIKYGDCDSKLTGILRKLYSFFIFEPRARIYANSWIS